MKFPRNVRAALSTVLGAVALGQSIRKFEAARVVPSGATRIERSVVALVPIDLAMDPSAGMLAAAGFDVLRVEPILCDFIGNMLYVSDKDARAGGIPHCDKFHAFNLTQFRHVLYLDADLILLQESATSLFDRGEHLTEERPFAAAPESGVPSLFNTGVLLVRPNNSLFLSLLNSASLREIPSYDGTDQGFLNSIYSDWYTWPATHRIPPKFNFGQQIAFGQNEKALRHAETQGGGIAIMHFMGAGKPWHYNMWRTILPSRESVEDAAMRRLPISQQKPVSKEEDFEASSMPLHINAQPYYLEFAHLARAGVAQIEQQAAALRSTAGFGEDAERFLRLLGMLGPSPSSPHAIAIEGTLFSPRPGTPSILSLPLANVMTDGIQQRLYSGQYSFPVFAMMFPADTGILDPFMGKFLNFWIDMAMRYPKHVLFSPCGADDNYLKGGRQCGPDATYPGVMKYAGPGKDVKPEILEIRGFDDLERIMSVALDNLDVNNYKYESSTPVKKDKRRKKMKKRKKSDGSTSV
jgi:lipopolysaccharide biosynthesis glycosyltransferase